MKRKATYTVAFSILERYSMKDLIKSYLSFTRRERIGLVALLALLLLLIIVKASMHLWIKPAIDNTQEQQLVAAWNAYKSETKNNISKNYYKADSSKAKLRTAEVIHHPDSLKPRHYSTYQQPEQPKGTLFPFDPNTLDSTGFRRLGLRERTTAILLHWRNKGKVFRHKEELRKVYTLTEEDYQRLEPYIRIKE